VDVYARFSYAQTRSRAKSSCLSIRGATFNVGIRSVLVLRLCVVACRRTVVISVVNALAHASVSVDAPPRPPPRQISLATSSSVDDDEDFSLLAGTSGFISSVTYVSWNS
jgi:hypothetical protein